MSFIQNLFTSRDNNANSATYVGQQDRLWWDPVTNRFYYSDGVTPGGFPVGAGGNITTDRLVNGAYEFVLDASGNIVAPGAISAVGNITANYFIGNGSQLSSISGANVTGQVANALVASIAVLAGTVTANAQPNITSVGTLTSISVSGNADVGNLNTLGQVSAVGNVTGTYFIGNGSQLTGLPDTYSNAQVAAFLASGTDTSNIITTANISGSYFIGNGSLLTGITATTTKIQNGNSWANVAVPNGNVVIGANGQLWTFGTNGNLTLPSNIASINYANGQPYGGSGNVTGGNVRIEDEGLVLTNAVNTINFAGNGVVATNTGNIVTVTISGAPSNLPVQTGNAGLVLMTDGGNLYWNSGLAASYEFQGGFANAIPPGATLDAGGANADYTGEAQIYGGVAGSDYDLTLSSIALTGQYEDLIDAPDNTPVPATTTSAGVKGQMAFNANWLYVCIDDNLWRRAALNTW